MYSSNRVAFGVPVLALASLASIALANCFYESTTEREFAAGQGSADTELTLADLCPDGIEVYLAFVGLKGDGYSGTLEHRSLTVVVDDRAALPETTRSHSSRLVAAQAS